MSRVVLSLVVVLTMTQDAMAKCANRIIHIEGSIVGASSEGLTIVVQVAPEPNWEPQPEIRIRDGQFAGMVLFDATASEGKVRDNCSRVPDSVKVVLFRNDSELALQRLAIAKDFLKSKNGDYRLRSPILLRP